MDHPIRHNFPLLGVLCPFRPLPHAEEPEAGSGDRARSHAIADVGWTEFKRQLTYKAAWRGGQVVLADRFYPSSKLCHFCGYKLEELALDVRRWTCPSCGAEHDRDLNAAQNLEQLVTKKRTASSAGSDACGAEKSMTSHGARQVLRVEAGTDVRLALR